MNDTISKARMRAKRMSRGGAMTHQQALDSLARDAGHAHWAAMLAANGETAAATLDPGLAQRINDYAETYEFRADVGDVTPTETERSEIEAAIAGFHAAHATPVFSKVGSYVAGLGLPDDDGGLRRHALIEDALHGFLDAEMAYQAAISPFEIDRFPMMPRPNPVVRSIVEGEPRLATRWEPELGEEGQARVAELRAEIGPRITIAAVERDLKRLMAREVTPDAARRSGMKLNEWISTRLRDAADAALARNGDDRPRPRMAQLPMTSDVTAYAMDPDHGPYERHDRMTVRCPLHDDGQPSLSIKGMDMRCNAGCPQNDLQSRLVERLASAAAAAVAFTVANDQSLVVEGWSHKAADGGESGGMGGSYKLDDGRIFALETLAVRMLPADYPKWHIG